MILKFEDKEYTISQEMWDAMNQQAMERNMTIDEYIAEALTKLKEQKKMKDTKEYMVYSNYMEGNREAKVVRHKVNDSWGVLMIEGNRPGFLEYYPTKSESWAEDCAENFVLGIKQL